MHDESAHEIPQNKAVGQVLWSADGVGIAEAGNVCLVVWRAAVTPARFRRQRMALEGVVTRHPGRAVLLCVVEPTTPPPDDEMRKASIEMVTRLGEALRCVACVIEGSGFKAAATRSVLSGMTLLLSNRKTDVKFTATLAAGASWAAQICHEVDVRVLAQLHEQLRQSLSTPS
jgi:hypothetical protein